MSIDCGSLRVFGNFTLDPSKRVLWFENRPVSLALKEVELLCVLTEQNGEVVTKQELLDRVWSDSFVEESNLSRHIYVLRKAFKDFGLEGVIETVPRRGYRFSAEINQIPKREVVIEKHTHSKTTIEIADSAMNTRERRPVNGVRAAVAVLALITIVTIGGFGIWKPSAERVDAAAGAPIRSVAVMPLRSFDNRDEELRLRITDALITKLGGLSGISVRPTSSVLGFIRDDPDAIDAGRKLEVDAVLEGRVQTEGDTLRVTLQLVSVASGRQIWSQQFDGKRESILTLQDHIAAVLGPRLTRDDIAGKRSPTTNAEAYESYLKGRYLWNKRRTAELKGAVAYFEQAIARDPQFALAYAGIADAYSQLANHGAVPPAEGYGQAKVMAQKALQIEPGLSEGYSALGWIAYIREWDWSAAEVNFAKAVELDPNNAEAHHWRALNSRVLGDNERFISEMETARKLSPLTKAIGRNYYEVVLLRDGCERAEEYIRSFTGLHELSAGERAEVLGFHHAACGGYGEVIEMLERLPDEHHSNKTRAYQGFAYARAGKTREALRMIEILKRSNSDGASIFKAYVHTALGDFTSAFAEVQKLVDSRDDRLVRLPSDPFLEPLKTDPRYTRLLEEIKLK